MENVIDFCPFCSCKQSNEIITENAFAYAIYDKFPVIKGHVLIITKNHCENYFDLNSQEQFACWSLINEVKKIIELKYKPNGFNIGINILQAAGQTIPHTHIHLIPRYNGDVKNPRGGIRWIFPDKADY